MIELKGLEIEFYLHDEECEKAKDLGMHRSMEDHEIRMATIYGVSSVVKHPKYTELSDGYDIFQCIESYDTLKKRIEENKVNLF